VDKIVSQFFLGLGFEAAGKNSHEHASRMECKIKSINIIVDEQNQALNS
jgi:hypothetical protein